ncbi:MAG: S-adenosylmethionine:tRNA ribosyltransferase-isomerase [Chitinophagaceae bacterium]|nr:S-adenosylmethionine:tRNA ribosyltransferase-isomerase [Chitinophagaceae bacterium]
MTNPKDLKIEDYSYLLPDERIAQYPQPERDSAKFLLYEKGALKEDVYRNIASHIPEHAMVVFNQTKVVQVRLLFKKSTGASIEVFCLEPDARYSDIQTAITQQGEVYWQCLVGGANKWKDGAAIHLHEDGLAVSATIIEKREGVFLIKIAWDKPNTSFAEVLQIAGKVPLPPYMQRHMQEEDKERYQTIYAQEEGSVAAPTAGLHFTPYIFEQFAARGIQPAFITLHVGAGTFKQVKTTHIGDHEMHAEWLDISLDFLKQLAAKLGNVIAVGTTSMRSLESLYWLGVKLQYKLPIDWSGNAVGQWDAYELEATTGAATAIQNVISYLEQQGLKQLVTRTQIMIAPGYKPQIVNALVTNFHQPNSTLLLLIAALMGNDWRKMYDYALANNFRFLSYGDGCFIKY